MGPNGKKFKVNQWAERKKFRGDLVRLRKQGKNYKRKMMIRTKRVRRRPWVAFDLKKYLAPKKEVDVRKKQRRKIKPSKMSEEDRKRIRAYHMRQGAADFKELTSIFGNIKKRKRSRQTEQQDQSVSTINAKAAHPKQSMKAIKDGLKHLSTPQPKKLSKAAAKALRPKFKREIIIPKSLKDPKTLAKLERMQKARNQWIALPNTIIFPKCSVCHAEMMIARGDQCYQDSYTASCDYCGRGDIHGNIWHCKFCADKPDSNGFDLCTSCGYLIGQNRHKEIRRPGPPEDDMGLLVNHRHRIRRKTMDGYTIYREDEIQKELTIGKGKGTKACPFDCDCCF